MNDKELLELAARAAGLRRPLLDIIGHVFGRLTVIQEVARVNPRKRQFICRCECGRETSLNMNKLRSGHTRSCGCLHAETILRNLENRQASKPIHGMNKSPEHGAWVQMRQRCSNSNKREWPYYGGRGIKVCEEWNKSFIAFFNHIGERPSDRHSLDRIDVNWHYEPGNVRWATHQEQAENTTVVRKISLDGETLSMSAWERKLGLPAGTICRRVSAGWGMEEAIRTPSIKGQKLHANLKRDYSGRARDQHGRYLSESMQPGADHE